MYIFMYTFHLLETIYWPMRGFYHDSNGICSFGTGLVDKKLPSTMSGVSIPFATSFSAQGLLQAEHACSNITPRPNKPAASIRFTRNLVPNPCLV